MPAVSRRVQQEQRRKRTREEIRDEALRVDPVANTVAPGATVAYVDAGDAAEAAARVAGDAATLVSADAYADGKVIDSIADADTTHAPSRNAVFDALALKSPIVTLSAIGASPNANAATLTGSALNLEPASASYGGVVTTGAQTLAGVKTFSDAPLVPDASADTEAVNLRTLRSYLATFDTKPECAYASTAALPSCNYANGTLGVGATLTGTANGPLVIDSITMLTANVGERILVAGQASSFQNGWYKLTQIGVVAVSPFILTRDTISDEAAEIASGYLTVIKTPTGLTPGVSNDGLIFISACASPIVVGTDSLVFASVGSAGITALTGDVTASGTGSVAATIANDAVTNAKQANMAAHTVKANITGGSADPVDSSLSAILDAEVSGTQGVMMVRGASVWGTIAPNTVGYVLTDNGAGAAPSFQSASAGTAVSQYDIPQIFSLALSRGNTHYWTIGNPGGSAASQGMGLLNATAGTGSFAVGTLAGTDIFNQSTRYVGTSGSTAGAQVWYTPSGAFACVRGGFIFSVRGAVADAATVANSRMFMGFRAVGTAPGNVEPDTLVDCIGLAAKAGDANLSIMYNDSSGTATMSTLGSSFPAQTLSTDVYRLEVYCAPGAGTIYYYVLRENTGATASGSFSSNLPTANTLMSPQFWRNNGTTALAVKIAVMSSYCKWNLEA